MDIVNRYRDNHNSSSSEDDSENSDDECAVWKRAKSKKSFKEECVPSNGIGEEPLIPISNNEEEAMVPSQQLPEEPKPGQKRKRNTIWCDVLQDQLISEDLEDCLLKNKPRHFGSRGKESYDYTQAYTDDRRDSESDMSGCSMNDDFVANSQSKKKGSFHNHKKFKNKFVKLSPSELEAARKINKVLNEKKHYLIKRIVKYAGIEKAMHYLEETKEIEENGGMMINSQSRRRTPGGVYFKLLKDDQDMTKEILDKIFEGEMSGYEMKKFFEEKRKMRRKNRHKRKPAEFSKKEAEIEPMEPDETALMEAEVINEEKLDVSNSEENLSSVPVPDKSPEKKCSLEDGELHE